MFAHRDMATRAGLCGALLLVASVCTADVYQRPEAFVSEAFAGAPPAPQGLFLIGALKDKVEAILGHRYRKIRVRYWLEGGRSAWVLEEIGKERPITTGFVIEDGAIQQVKVLIFRETRGWEVHYDFFTNQFDGARLTAADRLDRPIDNISGATLSVRALKKLARMALLLHERVIRGDNP